MELINILSSQLYTIEVTTHVSGFGMRTMLQWLYRFYALSKDSSCIINLPNIGGLLTVPPTPHWKLHDLMKHIDSQESVSQQDQADHELTWFRQNCWTDCLYT